MIILRYLSRDLIITSLSITAVLVVVIMSSDVTRYLWEAISGKIDPGALGAIIAFRMPKFLELILPLGFFVSILMVYGRLYAEQEMTVLFSCGLSRMQLLGISFVPALLVALLTGFISLWLSPYGVKQAELITEQQQSRSELDLLQTARFQVLGQGRLASYIEPPTDDSNTELGEIFAASMRVPADEPLTVIRAQSADRIKDENYQKNYLTFTNGARYEGRPGQANYRVTSFERYSQYLPEPEVVEFQIDEIKAQTPLPLLNARDIQSQAALQWRLSSPVIVFVVTLLGVALSHTTPRRGRYAMLFPSILLYLVYIVLLNAVRGMIEDGRYSPLLGLWSVHVLFIVIGMVLFIAKGGFWNTLFKRTSKTVAQTS